MTIRCLLVDDEPLSLKILQRYLDQVPGLELVNSVGDAFQAMEVLQKEKVDVLFLDINMPKLSGISLMKSLTNPPLVVFTTAYPEYAVEGFELQAVDYLLKPFSFERFFKAVNRVKEKLQTSNSEETTNGHLLVKVDKKLFKVDFEDILFLQAYGDYVKVHTKEKVLVTKGRLSNIEQNLPDSIFQRVHRSHIISLKSIQFIEGNLVQIGKDKLAIAPAYKDLLIEKLK